MVKLTSDDIKYGNNLNEATDFPILLKRRWLVHYESVESWATAGMGKRGALVPPPPLWKCCSVFVH